MGSDNTCIISLRHNGLVLGTCAQRTENQKLSSGPQGEGIFFLTVVAFAATRCRWWSRGPGQFSRASVGEGSSEVG